MKVFGWILIFLSLGFFWPNQMRSQIVEEKNSQDFYTYVYRIRRGDTLSRISRRFEFSVKEIAWQNGISDPDKIETGRYLCIYFPACSVTVASWYGPDFHGNLTANGEIYDMDDMTAAHRTLPFGTILLVRNLENSKIVQVRINDRGPFVDGRDLDLSREAARRLGAIGPGTVPVLLQIVHLGE